MRRSISIVVLVAAAMLNAWAPATAATALPWVSAPEAIVIDGWTGLPIFQKSAGVLRAPASTVKIMSALVVLEHHDALSRVVTVSPLAATYGGSTAGLYSGEQITIWNLLFGMLLPSGNDAAITLSQAVGGTIPAFVDMMNAEARRLHLWHTHYLTPNGYDMYGQVTTARDLAALARVAMLNTTFARVVRTRVWTARSADGRFVHQWSNVNHLLWSSHQVDGVKTGTTPGAGACLVSSARRGNRWIIAVNMGSTTQARFSDGAALLEYGFAVDAAPPVVR